MPVCAHREVKDLSIHHILFRAGETIDEGFTVTLYESNYKKRWNDFVHDSKNGVFLYNREFMEYHSERFADHSLLFTDSKGNLLALIPANLDGSVLHSHAGLTFGGVVSGDSMTLRTMMNVFESLDSYLRQQGIKEILYKAIPYHYHKVPSDEDLYALFARGASLVRREVSSVIRLNEHSNGLYSRLRRRKLKSALTSGMSVSRSYEIREYMNFLTEILKTRHDAKPVHTGDEIERLAGIFPDNIKLFVARDSSSTLQAGVIAFEHENVIRVQYSAGSEHGMEIGAVDLVYNYLMKTYGGSKEYLDFGTSMAAGSDPINEGLLAFKESFGARTVATDTYRLKVVE